MRVIMIGGYLLYVFTIIANGWVQLCLSHVLPEGVHLSRSCRPRCKPGETCVIYRTKDGTPNSTCIWLDPHRTVLDGTVIIPVQKPQRAASKRSPVTNTDSVRRQKTMDIGDVVKSVHNNVIDTARTVKSDRPVSDLITRMTALSQSLRHELLGEFGLLDKRPNLFKSKHIANKTERLSSFENLSPNTNKTSDTKKRKFEGLYLVRDANGKVSFRHADQQSNERVGVQEVPISFQTEGDSSAKRILNNEWSNNSLGRTRVTTPRVIQVNATQPGKRKHFTGNGAACKPCDPDYGCPDGFYCYLSKPCAIQICQRL